MSEIKISFISSLLESVGNPLQKAWILSTLIKLLVSAFFIKVSTLVGLVNL